MSVLRYPGGKSRAIEILNQFVPKNITEMCSPFIGGGSFEIHCAEKRGIDMSCYDVYEPLVNFWKELLDNSKKLYTQVKKVHPLSKADFNKYKGILENKDIDCTKRAAYFYAINRSSFSGSTMSGGYSKDAAEKRFNKSSMERIKNFSMNNITVDHADFTDSIQMHDELLFLDPPYYLGKNSKLYGNKGSTHENFDHKTLFEMLNQRENWILCYNNCDYIKDLYENYTIYDVNWSYGMSKNKESKEIVIVSDELN